VVTCASKFPRLGICSQPVIKTSKERQKRQVQANFNEYTFFVPAEDETKQSKVMSHATSSNPKFKFFERIRVIIISDKFVP
jgi:hypothetical protein